jgi:hypothetical protein
VRSALPPRKVCGMDPAGTISSWRLASQQLARPRWQEPERVVAWLGGVQAQDDRWAQWSIGLRMRDATEAAVQRAVKGRQIVRTWAFRGTLHYLAAADVRWLLSFLAPTIIAGNARRYRQLELDEATFARSDDVIRRALEREGALVRSEIASVLEEEGISAQGQRAPYLLQRAALDGVICHGAPRGREPTYVLLSEWIGTREGSDSGQGVDALAARYLASHGPATVHDFAWWAGLRVTAARQAVRDATSLVRVESGGKELWAAQGAPPPPVQGTAYLLPPFDDYLLGYKDRSAALDPAYAKRVNRGGGMPRPAIVVDGKVVGTWRRATKSGKTIVTLELFRALDRDESRAVEEAARRYGTFASAPVEIQQV